MSEEIPSEFTDDEKWFKFFSKNTFLFIICSVFFTLMIAGLFKTMFGKGAFFPCVIVCAIPTIVIAGMMMITKSTTEYLKGGGQSYWSIFIKKIIRKANARIYVLGWDGL